MKFQTWRQFKAKCSLVGRRLVKTSPIEATEIDMKKRFNGKSVKPRHKQSLFDKVETKYCATPGCSTKMKFTSNIVHHMKECAQQKLRKEQKAGNKICHYCGKRFKQKSNTDRHVKRQEDGIVNDHADADEIVDDSPFNIFYLNLNLIFNLELQTSHQMLLNLTLTLRHIKLPLRSYVFAVTMGT